MNILALDPATHCGWALYHNGNLTASGTWDLSIRRDESGGMRLVRLRGKLMEVMQGIDLVVFESARNAGPRMQGALVVQSELQGVIKLFCECEHRQYRGYSPTEIKRFATGKGNAKKPDMIEAAKRLWPMENVVSDDQADALCLLSLALSEYGATITSTAGDN